MRKHRNCWKAIKLQLITKSSRLRFWAFRLRTRTVSLCNILHRKSSNCQLAHEIAALKLWRALHQTEPDDPLWCRKNLFRLDVNRQFHKAEPAIAAFMNCEQTSTGMFVESEMTFPPRSPCDLSLPFRFESVCCRQFLYGTTWHGEHEPGHWIYSETLLYAPKNTWTHHTRCR